jgi:hypothetical protein
LNCSHKGIGPVATALSRTPLPALHERGPKGFLRSPASDEGRLLPFPPIATPSARDVCPQLAPFNIGRAPRRRVEGRRASRGERSRRPPPRRSYEATPRDRVPVSRAWRRPPRVRPAVGACSPPWLSLHAPASGPAARAWRPRAEGSMRWASQRAVSAASLAFTLCIARPAGSKEDRWKWRERVDSNAFAPRQELP